ncbi:homeobox-leucine zipper protein ANTHOCYANINLESS 2-like [Bidens hawaiensis]|uniref:homeobox-leucine zipper protein ANTHOCYANINLESS 2-like n=1 Tax=Bidens hawaiensis TaxID=980011 RepID=UPI00404B990B
MVDVQKNPVPEPNRWNRAGTGSSSYPMDLISGLGIFVPEIPTRFHELQKPKIEGYNYYGKEIVLTTASGGNENSEFASSNEQEIHRSSSSQRVQYTRHSPYQIEELERLFKKNDHPGEKERIDIGIKLNMEEKKAQMKRDEISSLKKENEKLKLEILALKEAAKNSICSKCGAQATILDSFIEQQKLKIENERLKEKLNRVTALLLTNNYVKFAEGSSNNNSTNPLESQSQMRNEIYIQKNGYLEQASRAMEEILRLGLVNAPLWKRNKEGGGETLEFVEYVKAFTPCLDTKPPGFVSEATRASSMVPISGSALVEALLNADQWRDMFTGLIGSCTTMEVISQGLGGSRSGALQLLMLKDQNFMQMKVEIQVISPIVPVRVLKFIRFTKQQAEGLWIMADLSIKNGMEGHVTRRCPSGCVIHDMRNGLSKITWIEHVEYNKQSVPYQYRKLISSGLGFGEKRWISALLRHCEGIRATTSPTLNTHLLKDTKGSLKCLAQRMKSIFCAGICLTDGQGWELISEAPGTPRVMEHKCVVGSSEPLLITSATYSVWIPTNHQHLFGLLIRQDLRCMWDLICHKIATNDMIHFPLGQDKNDSNCILTFNSNTLVHDDQIMVLQENSSDMTGSLIVYATVDYSTLSLLLYGKDTSSVALMPLGLSFVPGYGEDGTGSTDGECGSMVTVEYQILQATPNLTTETISTINDLVLRTVLGIKEIV